MIAKDLKENEKAYVKRLPKSMLRRLWREQKTLPIIDGKQEFLQGPTYLCYPMEGVESVALP